MVTPEGLEDIKWFLRDIKNRKWIMNYDTAYLKDETCYSCNGNVRWLSVEKVYKVGSRNEISRYDIVEAWWNYENPDSWRNGYTCDKRRVPIISFENGSDAYDFLELFVWVLNAPSTVPFDTIISQRLIDIVQNADPDALKLLRERESKAKSEWTVNHGDRVYIFQMADGRIKIGKSCNVATRRKAVEGHSGIKVVKWCCSAGLNNAYEIESLCHQHFADYRCEVGEFFSGITFDDARDYLQTLVKIDYDS